MSTLRIVAVAALALLFTFVTAALGVYEHRQSALTLEGNSLYSSNAVAVRASPLEVTRLLTRDHLKGRVFTSLTDDGRVRALTTVGTPSDPLPLHSGRQPVAGDDHVALLGSAVPVEKRPGADAYVFNGESYEVIGRLGLDESSLVADDALVVDAGRNVDAGTASLVVDSPAAASLFRSAIEAGTAAPLAASTNRRTNIDVVSPILTTYGGALALIGFALTGALAGAGSRARYAVAHVMGASHSSALLRALGLLFVVLIPTVLAGVVFRIIFTTTEAAWARGLAIAGIQIFLATGCFLLGVTRRSREERP